MSQVRHLRRSLLKNHQSIEVTDFGTGLGSAKTRTISGIASSSNQPKISQMLYNVCRYYQPQVILELGTNLGLSTLSMAAGSPQAKIVTIEGCPEISKQAVKHFNTFEKPHIEMVTGEIDTVLPRVLMKLDSIDLVFIDANHRYRATVNYLRQCLPRCHAQSIVLIDDIYHSSEMKMAWNEIKQWPELGLTVDLFLAGFALFRPQLNKRHYVLEF